MLSLSFPIHHPAHRPRIGRLLTKRAAVGSSPAGRRCRGPPHGPWRSGLAAAATESSVLGRRRGEEEGRVRWAHSTLLQVSVEPLSPASAGCVVVIPVLGPAASVRRVEATSST